MAKYLMEMRQGDDSVAQDFGDMETMLLVLQAMLDGECPVECLISKLRPEAANEDWEDEVWFSGKESKRG